MNIALRHDLTVPDFLAWAETQSERQRAELINGQIVAMSPERVEHTELKFAVAVALTHAIAQAGIDAHALTDGPTVAVDAHTAYQPDALVYAGPRLPRGSTTVASPIILVEVLSPSTAHTDKSAKLIGYFQLPSVMHYLVVDPETLSLVHHARAADGGVVSSTHSAGTLRLDPPGLDLRLADVFGRR